jgi:DNA repair protein RecO (recombination protein O)
MVSQVHKTKGIVLRTVKYGETSVIASVYTELFGVQSYIVKGVRQSSKKSQGKAGYFQAGAILEMEVYHNDLKNLQFIKDFQWDYLYASVFFDVVKNAVAMYMIELLQHSMKQPEANPELFYMIEESLKQLDKGNDALVANLPLYFTLHLGTELGFQLQGTFSDATPVLDLVEGQFTGQHPSHQHYIDGELAKTTSSINAISFYTELEQVKLSRNIRRQLLEAYQTYIALHVQDFGEMRSWKVLQEILG